VIATPPLLLLLTTKIRSTDAWQDLVKSGRGSQGA
jgi:hypothetical protein